MYNVEGKGWSCVGVLVRLESRVVVYNMDGKGWSCVGVLVCLESRVVVYLEGKGWLVCSYGKGCSVFIR